MPIDDPRNYTLQVRLTPKERAELDVAADRIGLPVSTFVRTVVRRVIRQNEVGDIERLAEPLAESRR